MGIEGFTQESGLKVKMRTRRASGRSSKANGLAGKDNLILSH